MSKRDSDAISLFFVLLLVSFVCLMPPFIGSGANALAARLALETSVLGGMAIYLFLRKGVNPFVGITVVFALYMMNWIFSAENVRQVLSHFNKLLLLYLLSEALVLNYPLASFLKRVWIVMWVCFCSLAIAVLFLDMSGLMRMTPLVGYSYDYYHYPFLGSVLFKNFGGVQIPRYTGFLHEPIVFSFFAGFNMVAARWLLLGRKRMWAFLLLNMVAGLLTFSFAFYVFLALFLVFWKPIRRIPPKYVVIGAVLFILLVALVGGHVPVPYSSFANRVGRYDRSLDYIQTLGVGDILFGVGAIPFLQAIGSGSSSALLDIFVSRGIFLFFVWTYLLHTRCRYVPGLFFFIVFYSLFVDFWNYPLFVVGVAIVTSYSRIRLSASRNGGGTGSQPRHAAQVS